jgi:hypothetical protein
MYIETNVLNGHNIYKPNRPENPCIRCNAVGCAECDFGSESVQPPAGWGQSSFKPYPARTQRLIDSICRRYNVVDDAISHGSDLGHEFETDGIDSWKYTSLLVKENWLIGHISTKFGDFDFLPFGHLPATHPTVFLGKRCFICNKRFRENDLVDFVPTEPFYDGIARAYLSHRGCFHLYIAGLNIL